MHVETVVRKKVNSVNFGSRINAATRANGMSYSRFICGLTKAGVQVNRKMLADVAINDAAAFAKLVEVAKSNL